MKSQTKESLMLLAEALVGLGLAVVMVSPFLFLITVYGCSKGFHCLF